MSIKTLAYKNKNVFFVRTPAIMDTQVPKGFVVSTNGRNPSTSTLGIGR